MRNLFYDSPTPEPKNDTDLLDDGTVRLHLNGGQFALIDAADLPLVAHRRWHAQAGKYTTYARYTDRDGKGGNFVVHMHRLILGLERGDRRHVDHINHNGLDNRRSNLRIASRTENMANSTKPRLKSPYRGVAFYPAKDGGGKWQARIRWRGRQLNLGLYETPEEAAREYDLIAVKLYGEFATLNFPE